MGFKDRQAKNEAAREADSPQGRARAARENGDALFHLTVPTTAAQVALNEVTAEGWQLIQMAVGFLPGQQVEYLKGISAVNGTMMGYYVFTRR